MNTKTTHNLTNLRDELLVVIEDYSQKLADSTSSIDLQDAMQLNIIDKLSETTEKIEEILDDIDNGRYDEVDPEFDEEEEW